MSTPSYVVFYCHRTLASTPSCLLLPQLTTSYPVVVRKAYVRHTAHLLSQFDKGAGLEFVFCMTASIGFVIEGINTNKTTMQIPPATEVWVQPSYGSIPTDFGNSYQHCLLVKLAENHVAVDFLLVVCSSGGVQGRV